MLSRVTRVGLCALLFLSAVSTAAQAVQVRDDDGVELKLAQPARRIISLVPHATEMLYAIGAGRQLVAVSRYSNWPPPARRLPRVSGAAGIDVEAILALHPDLVVAWRSGIPASAVQRLRGFGVPVFMSEPRGLDDIPRTMEKLGRLAGREGSARKAAEGVRLSIHELRARYRGKRRVRVFYEIWPRPLMTIGGTHFINDVIRACGGENVFSHRAALDFSVSTEAVLAARPQVILAGATGRDDWRRSWRRWPQLPAVARNQLYGIPPDLIHRPGPRLVQGAARMCVDIDRARRAISH